MALFTVFCLPLYAQHVYDMARFGIQPGKKSNMSTRMEKALAKIRKEVKEGEAVTLRFQSGTYHFYPEGAANPKLVINFYNERRKQLLEVKPNRGHVPRVRKQYVLP
jgi:hypothetical protein